MLRVHVCEDNKEQRENLVELIRTIIQVEQFDMELGMIAEAPEQILSLVKDEKNTGVYFLDIDLKSEMTGIDLARTLREYQPRCFIIFVTTHSEMSYMTFSYKVEAMDFIIKDNYYELKNRVHQCLVHAEQLHIEVQNKKLDKCFPVKVGHKVQEVAYDEILYFEVSTNVRKLIVHTKTQCMEFCGKIKELDKNLDKRFYRCHRAYIVNKNNIVDVNTEERMVQLVGGEKIPMSVRLGKDLIDEYTT